MGQITNIRYSGEIGFFANIEEVHRFLRIRCSLKDFLAFKSPSGVENSQTIFSAYQSRLKIKLGLSNESGEEIKNHESITPDMPCPNPIVFYIDSELIEIDLIVNQSNLLVQAQTFDGGLDDKQKFSVGLNDFYDKNIRSIKSSIPDSSKTVLDGIGQSSTFTSVLKTNPEIKVWIWCKTLCENGIFNKYSTFDLTPFVQSVSTNQTETGGNFNINLLPIEGFLKVEDGQLTGVWSPNKKRYVKFNNGSKKNFFFKKLLDSWGVAGATEPTDKSTRFQGNTLNNIEYADLEALGGLAGYLHNENLFKNLISENDMIFISFEKKKMANPPQGDLNGETSVDVLRSRETGEILEDDLINDFFVNCDYIYENAWDFIGLVDTNGENLDYETTNQDLTITGRDCMKLLLEDGSYFFAKSYSKEDSDGIFHNVNLPYAGDGGNTTNKRIKNLDPKGVNRLITTGIIDMLYNPEARNVQFILNLLISRLANIEICPSSVFDSYGTQRTEFSIPTVEYVDEDSEDEIKQSDTDGD